MTQVLSGATPSLRQQIALGIQALFAGILDPDTGAPLFATVQLGSIFAPQSYTTWAEIAFHQGKSGPAGMGGQMIGWRIEDALTFTVTSGWVYDADASAAMLAMLHAQDIVLPLLHSHVKIPAPNMPEMPIASVWSVLEDSPDRALPVRMPGGQVYLLWSVSFVVRQQYNVVLLDY